MIAGMIVTVMVVMIDIIKTMAEEEVMTMRGMIIVITGEGINKLPGMV